MLKALIKKQFMELFRSYFNNKSGERRSNKGIIGLFAIFAVLMLFLGTMFFFVANSIIVPFAQVNLVWLYFVIMSVLAILFGVFGSVFNTFTALYKAKDNEFLLSLPIKPSKILFVRLISVYALSLLYESIIYIPTLIAYYISGYATIGGAITSLLMLFVLAFLISVLTCLFGFIVAFISSKLKGKSIITVLIAIIFFAVYYFICFKSTDLIEKLISEATVVGQAVKDSAYPLYLFGLGINGNILCFLVTTLIVAVLVVITYYIMSKTFTKIVTTTEVSKKKNYVSRQVKTKSVQRVLLEKELKRFVSSSSYMLNCGFGILFLVIIISALFIGKIALNEVLEQFALEGFNVSNIAPPLFLGIGLIMSSTCQISAPSVSLEGKSIWVLQTMPVDSAKILKAKLYAHCLIILPFLVLLSVAITLALNLPSYYILLFILCCIAVTMFNATLGVIMGIKKPNFNWVNEMYVIKQGLAVSLTLLAGMLLSVVFVVLGYLAALVMNTALYIALFSVLVSIAVIFMFKWLVTKGANAFNTLS